MSTYSELPIYGRVFSLLKDLYERVPRFSKQYKYLPGESTLGCCVDCIALINQTSDERDNERRITYASRARKNTKKLSGISR